MNPHKYQSINKFHVPHVKDKSSSIMLDSDVSENLGDDYLDIVPPNYWDYDQIDESFSIQCDNSFLW